MKQTIFFDMDGTIADLYGVENLLDYLIEKNPLPYEIAKPLVRLSTLARYLNKLQKQGYRIGVISWLSKDSNNIYDELVTYAKMQWLEKHLASVHFNEIHIVNYGTPKELFSNGKDILFDDEEKNRNNWLGTAYDVDNIIDTLKSLMI